MSLLRICGVVASGTLISCLSACGTSDADPAILENLRRIGITSPQCANSAQKTAPAAGLTAVLLDRTASTLGSSGAPDYATLIDPLLKEAATRGDAVAVAGFDGTAATVHWIVVPTAFSGDPNLAKIAENHALECIRARVSEALSEPSERPGSDPLGAIASAKTVLDAAPADSRRLLMATDGLATKGCADLNALPVGGSTALVLKRCEKAKETVRSIESPVTVLGLGISASAQELPDSTQLEWLTGLWRSLCSQLSGSECAIQPRASLVGSRPAAEGAQVDAKIVWPEVEIDMDGGTVTLDLPQRMLFDTDSSLLQGKSNIALQSVQDEVQAVDGTITEIIGHADSTGRKMYNQSLSEARAQTVADELERRFGLTARRVHGVGSSEPKCPGERTPEGDWDEAALQCNRRVEVVIRFDEQGASR